MAKQNTGDCIVRVDHESGSDFFGPLFYRHRDPAKNVYSFEAEAKRRGYTAERILLYPVAAWESFMEARKPKQEVEV